MNFYFSPYILPAVWIVLGCGLFFIAFAVSLYFYHTRRVLKGLTRASEENLSVETKLPPVSVIVYCEDDAENLEKLLECLTAQEYEGSQYEVIVVNEGESADVRELMNMKRRQHSNLYLTSTPEGVRNLSRKKLGITLGIKAARHEIVVLTTTASEIPSTKWLKTIVRGFQPPIQADVVLGFARMSPDYERKFGDRRRVFDFVAESVRWISAALAKRPFRGMEYNLAYRKALFMENSGFARSLNLHYGDDDIFISEIARGSNTHMELAPDSIVSVRGGNSPRFQREQHFRRSFTESFIRRHKPLGLYWGGVFQLIGWICLAGAAVIGLPNLFPAACAFVVVLLGLWGVVTSWSRITSELGWIRLRMTIPWLSITYPFRKNRWKFRAKFGKGRKYTWN